MLQSMGWQRDRHNLVAEQQQKQSGEKVKKQNRGGGGLTFTAVPGSAGLSWAHLHSSELMLLPHLPTGKIQECGRMAQL